MRRSHLHGLLLLGSVLGAGCPATDSPTATGTPIATSDAALEEADASPLATGKESDPALLAAALRPIDSPLPSRASLEAGYEDPVALLLQVASPSWPEPIERENALSELGLFAEDRRANQRLIEVAVDTSAAVGDRVGALQGLNHAEEVARAQLGPLLSLLDEPQPRVQAATVLLVADWPEAREPLERLANSSSTHPDVRRFAARAVEGGSQ